MNSPIPSGADLSRLLAPLSNAQLVALAHHSGVPFTTLWKIRAAETSSPGIETVRKFYPLVWPAVCIPDLPAGALPRRGAPVVPLAQGAGAGQEAA